MPQLPFVLLNKLRHLDVGTGADFTALGKRDGPLRLGSDQGVATEVEDEFLIFHSTVLVDNQILIATLKQGQLREHFRVHCFRVGFVRKLLSELVVARFCILII